MNTTAMSSPLITPQGMNKSPGGGMMVGVALPPTTAPGGLAPPNTAPAAGGTMQPTATMANTKEKTPMCLINELARFNKIQHQYRLVEETGPAHKKTFTVVLRLDSEEYTASGSSIKRAQHAAAAQALKSTSFKHPPPKPQNKSSGPLTPTVELNALAMKRGELAIYQVVEVPRLSYIPNFNFRGMYHQRYHYPKVPPTYCATLEVGERRFFGEGTSEQAARHAAAEQALSVLRDLPLPEHVKKRPDTESDLDNELKSPIGLVHEIALKHNLSVDFEVIQESGPPHMRTFITRCTVGEIVTEGEGNGKKVSKKRAAERMLEELKKLPSLPPTQQKLKKKPVVKKKSRNLIKEQKSDSPFGQSINPISRLIQIQQAKKEREPVYTVIAERGDPRQREFVIQCTLGNLSTQGTGPNKKTAKRNAAEAMLQCMGYSRPQPQAAKPGIRPIVMEDPHVFTAGDGDKQRKMGYLDHDGDKIDSDGKLGRQLVPGLLLMPDAGRTGDQTGLQGFPPGMPSSGLNRAPGGTIQTQDAVGKMTMRTTSTVAKELLDKGASPTAEALRKSGHKTMAAQSPIRPKQQLMYLADVLGFQVHFTDFPKGNKMEFLSLVTLTTNPPQVSHGAGPTKEASHDQAALTVLRTLAELGLDSVTNGTKPDSAPGLVAGDGLHMMGGQGSVPRSGGDLKSVVNVKDTR